MASVNWDPSRGIFFFLTWLGAKEHIDSDLLPVKLIPSVEMQVVLRVRET